MPDSNTTFPFWTETSPYANYSTHFTPNATDPCLRHNNALLAPLDYPSTAYIAIGPVSNFSSALHSCCPNKAANAVQNYDGGNNRGKAPEYDPPLQCYYFCSWNGSYVDVDAALNCTKKVAEESGEHDRYVLAASPDSPKVSAGVRGGGLVGAWKCAVLGMLVGAALM